MRKKKDKIPFSAYLYLVPAVALMTAFVFLPLVQSLGYSFYRFDNFMPDRFVGFQNFETLFADATFWNSLKLTLVWAFMSAVIPGFVGLVLALLLEYRTSWPAFSGICRTVLFMPMMMSMVAVGLLWSLIYNPMLGLLNGFLTQLGLASNVNPVDLLGNPDTALYAAFAITVWQGSGFSMVIFSAALQGVSKDVVEAGMIDGANKFQQIRYISIPSIVATITTVFTVNMISGFKAFDLLQVLTQGGPSNATLITSLYMYRQAFFAFKFDYASAMAVLLFACIIVFVILANLCTDRINRRLN